MTVRELYSRLDAMIPTTLSCDWDNDGLMCCPDGERQVRRVLIALDVTAQVAEVAVQGGYDAVISHHPIIFKGIKAVDDRAPLSAKLLKLIGAGVAVMSFHTRLDCVQGGVNDKLCELFELGEVEEVFAEGLPLGRIGYLPQSMSAHDLALLTKDVLEAPAVLLSDGGVEARRICVAGGSGSDLLPIARAMGADSFISGRVGYHEMTDGSDNFHTPMNIIEAGHFYTEHPVCEVLLDAVHDIDPSVECDICSSNIIELI